MEILTVVEMAGASGLPEDAVSNNFAWVVPEDFVGSGDEALLALTLAAFYNEAGANGQRVTEHIGAGVSRGVNASSIKMYDITGKLANRGPGANGKEQGPPPHGSPFHEEAWTLGAEGAGATTFPGECSICITLRANTWQAQLVEAPDGGDLGNRVDRPRQRKSGRIFIPRVNSRNAQLLNGRQTLSAGGRTTMLNAVDGMQAAAAALGCFLSVWSRQDGSLNPVTDVQVDDEYDIQRRRGYRPQVRETRNIAVFP